jgi:hypothetical protein
VGHLLRAFLFLRPDVFLPARKLKGGVLDSTMITLDKIVSDIMSAHGLISLPSAYGDGAGWSPDRELVLMAHGDRLFIHLSIIDKCISSYKSDRLLQRTALIGALKKEESDYRCMICGSHMGRASIRPLYTYLGYCPACEKKCQEDFMRLVSQLVLIPIIFGEDCGSHVARYLILAS